MPSSDNTVEGVAAQIERLLARVQRAMATVCGCGEEPRVPTDLEYLRNAFGESTGNFPRLNERLLWLADKQLPAVRKAVRSQAAGYRKTFKEHKAKFFEALPGEKRTSKPQINVEGATNELGPKALNQIKQTLQGGGRPQGRPAFTQKAVAALLGLKSGEVTVANWEHHRTKPPLNYTKEMRVKGGKEFFDFVCEYNRINGVNENLKKFLQGKVLYIEGLSEKQMGRVQEFIQELSRLRYN